MSSAIASPESNRDLVAEAFDKKFDKNSLDISSVHGENKITNDKTRGEVNYDNRRIREVSSENAGSRDAGWAKGTDGGRNTHDAGETQKVVEGRDIDPAVRKAVKKVVKSHINSSAKTAWRTCFQNRGYRKRLWIQVRCVFV
jgi:hypothetical protein